MAKAFYSHNGMVQMLLMNVHNVMIGSGDDLVLEDSRKRRLNECNKWPRTQMSPDICCTSLLVVSQQKGASSG